MAATPILAQGTVFKIDDGTLANLITIAGIVSITGMGSGSATEIPATTLASTAKEFKQGLQDFGDVTLQLIRDNDDTGQAELFDAMTNQAIRQFTLDLPSSTLDLCTFYGFVKQITTDVNSDGIVTGTCVIRVTGLPVWS